MRYVAVLLNIIIWLYFPSFVQYLDMERVKNISKGINISDIYDAAQRSFKGHNDKPEVVNFKKNFENNCLDLFEALSYGYWKDYLGYRPMEKIGRNGKRRKILSPNLITRIYQHLFLNIIEPIYYTKDNKNGLNCKKGCGITSSNSKVSIVHKLKHLYYDRLDLNYCLVIDQRKCYEHVTIKAFRKMLKKLIYDPWLVDFAVEVCFVKGKLPIGTPTSPMVHHILMLTFDIFAKDISAFSLRYADDNFLAFHTKEDAQAAKWRIKNYWWYVLGIRAKRGTSIIKPLSEPCDFCGYVFHRNNKGKTEHNKGYVKIRKRTADTARRCNRDESWSSYFGLMKHADSFSLMKKIEKLMKLRKLTEKIKIDRKMDAPHKDIQELLDISFDIYDYEIRDNNQGEPNWIKFLIGIPEVKNGKKTGKNLAYEFHGNYQSLIKYLKAREKVFTKDGILPLKGVEIENQCGYIFKGSTNQITYIQEQ